MPRMLAATSQPMNPAPTTTARCAGTGLFAQRQTLVEGPQHVNTLEIGERRDALGHQARGDDQLVIRQLAAVGQSQRLRVGVHRPGAVAEQNGDVVLLVELGRLESHVVGLGAQHFLGQRRPVVGQMVLVADDRDGPGVLRPP